MLPAVIDDHRPVGIQSLGKMIDLLCKMLLPGICFHLGDSPGFVKRRPGNDTGMAVILPYNLHPLPGKFLHRIVVKLIGRPHLAPHQNALLITPVKESFVLGFLMFPQTVVSQSQDLVNVFHQGFLPGRRQVGILPVALIQDQPLIKGPAVEQDVRSFYCDLPHAEIGHYLILILSRFQGAVQVVKVRLLRLPLQDPPLSEIFLITENIQPGPPMSSGYRSLHTRNIPSLKAGFQIQKDLLSIFQKRLQISPYLPVDLHRLLSEKRGDLQTGYI